MKGFFGTENPGGLLGQLKIKFKDTAWSYRVFHISYARTHYYTSSDQRYTAARQHIYKLQCLFYVLYAQQHLYACMCRYDGPLLHLGSFTIARHHAPMPVPAVLDVHTIFTVCAPLLKPIKFAVDQTCLAYA